MSREDQYQEEDLEMEITWEIENLIGTSPEKFEEKNNLSKIESYRKTCEISREKILKIISKKMDQLVDQMVNLNMLYKYYGGKINNSRGGKKFDSRHK